MEATGLIGPYYRWRETQLARQSVERVDDGLPMPPARLITKINGGPDERWFSEKGRSDADQFRALALAEGIDLSRPHTVLDFGCGSGRIARWLAPAVVQGGGRFLGSDLNGDLVSWCQANLPGRYFRNSLQPPLALEPAGVDLVYAHSVLTHLTERTAQAWLAELRRILKPGGCAILTFHDETYAGRWGPPEVSALLKAQGYVVWNNALEGSNYMSAWTDRAHFADLAKPWFEVSRILEGGAETPVQAIAVLRAGT
ncbi:MAG TPA: class I SAM-dependent methyltransferase [Phenylobacterium sp.]|nr:class I SAM-dependent methyltransferase [Phenylobacterium sp.]